LPEISDPLAIAIVKNMFRYIKESAMQVHLKCFTTLVNPETCDFTKSTPYDLKDQQTVKDLIEKAGVDPSEVKVAFVNNRVVDLSKVLADGDRVGLSPAVGGM
jgi:sulfur carrier protein ThiS